MVFEAIFFFSLFWLGLGLLFSPIPDSVGEIEIVGTEGPLTVQIPCRNVENQSSGVP